MRKLLMLLVVAGLIGLAIFWFVTQPKPLGAEALAGKARLIADWEKRESEAEGLAREAAGALGGEAAPPAIAMAFDWGFSADTWPVSLSFEAAEHPEE